MNIKSIAGHRTCTQRRRAGTMGVALATALVTTLAAACGEAVYPPVTGAIIGTVSIEGTGVEGVTVTLDTGLSTMTAGGGAYRFDDLDAGTYSVAITDIPPHGEFEQTSATATIATIGETVTVDFNGSYVRTARVMGSVTVAETGIAGVSVALGGTETKSTRTDADGNYDFPALLAGDYTVTISDFDRDMYTFGETSRSVSVGVGESRDVSFAGTHTRLPGQVDYRVRIENISRRYEFSASGQFAVPLGADGPGLLLPGGKYEFEFHAGPGQHLSFATKFVQSNDLFLAPDGNGVALWGDDGAVTGDITDRIRLWDAGTEANQEPGSVGDPPARGGGNSGTADPDPNVRLATDDFGNLPEVTDMIRVTLHHDGASPTLLRATIENISTATTLMTADGASHSTSLAPGVFVVHSGANPLFTVGEPDRGEGLEELAEDGTVSTLAEAVAERSGLTTLIAPGVYATHAAGPFLFSAGATASIGLEAMAEDGDPALLDIEVRAAGRFRDAGMFAVPLGAAGPAQVGPGQAYEFSVIATPGDALSFVTMFVQSNDLFYAPPQEGIDLFPGGVALEGDITDRILLWDAGTEVNEKPGLGVYQLPRQPGPSTGPVEDGVVKVLDPCFTYPNLSDVLRVTLTKVAG